MSKKSSKKSSKQSSQPQPKASGASAAPSAASDAGASAGSRSDARNRFFLAAFAKANRAKSKQELLALCKFSEQDARAQHLPMKYAMQIRSLLIANKLI
jgi:hypothetical protein